MLSKIRFSAFTLALLITLTTAQSAQRAGSTAQSDRNLAADSMSADDVKASEADLEKMRVILNQMKTNVAFVGSTTTPVNHQFQLEIQMWEMLLDQMERRLEARRKHPGSSD